MQHRRCLQIIIIILCPGSSTHFALDIQYAQHVVLMSLSATENDCPYTTATSDHVVVGLHTTLAYNATDFLWRNCKQAKFLLTQRQHFHLSSHVIFWTAMHIEDQSGNICGSVRHVHSSCSNNASAPAKTCYCSCCLQQFEFTHTTSQ